MFGPVTFTQSVYISLCCVCKCRFILDEDASEKERALNDVLHSLKLSRY